MQNTSICLTVEKEWQVAVTTGDQEGSGTEAQVYLTIFGELGDTGPLELGQAGGEGFAQGTSGAELTVSGFSFKKYFNLSMSILFLPFLLNNFMQNIH